MTRRTLIFLEISGGNKNLGGGLLCFTDMNLRGGTTNMRKKQGLCAAYTIIPIGILELSRRAIVFYFTDIVLRGGTTNMRNVNKAFQSRTQKYY